MGATQSRSWTVEVAEAVGGRLGRFFEQRHAEAREISPRAEELTRAVSDLTLRGGKRLRPCAAYAGFRAVCSDGDPDALWDLGAALELLQSYLLIQDDWMDGDEERRGGPAVHVSLSRAHGDDHLGAGLAFLAADLASGFAWELVGLTEFPAGRSQEGMRAFARMHFEVVAGQQLDMLAHPEVALTHHLKSGSYTVRGPLQLGAVLGNASADQLASLAAVGQPVGVAFQLRDDLLGTFGDPAVTGKPAGNDLRAGKLTSLVAEAKRALSEAEFEPIARVVEGRDGSAAAVTTASALIEACGARDRVEGQLRQLLAEAQTALATAAFEPKGARLLQDLLEVLTVRNM